LQIVERDIFDLLIQNIGRVVNKERFYEVMEKDSSLALRVHIANLKKRLGIDILNIRGIGYRLEKV
jgi:DNA-binding response OmpR family regulator